jgi:serine/threonine protein kinase
VVKDGYSPQEFYLTGAEQAPSSDLYALGATFYHVITGKVPPESQRRLAALAGGTADPCQPLAGRYPGYPPGFLESIDAALRVLQKDRLQSASDWLQLVQTSLAQHPTGPVTPASSAAPPRPTTTATRAAPWVQLLAERPQIALAAGALALVVLAVLFWSILT